MSRQSFFEACLLYHTNAQFASHESKLEEIVEQIDLKSPLDSGYTCTTSTLSRQARRKGADHFYFHPL
jgi:hypothetical protein